RPPLPRPPAGDRNGALEHGIHRLPAAVDGDDPGAGAGSRTDSREPDLDDRPRETVRERLPAGAAERRRDGNLGKRLVGSEDDVRAEGSLWRGLSVPGVVWLLLFVVVPAYAVVAVAFGQIDTLLQPVPVWNPLDWNVGFVKKAFTG